MLECSSVFGTVGWARVREATVDCGRTWTSTILNTRAHSYTPTQSLLSLLNTRSLIHNSERLLHPFAVYNLIGCS